MKSKYIYKVSALVILLFASFTVFQSCNKLNQFPKSSLSPETFFRTEKDLQTYTNQFYDQIIPSAHDIFYSPTYNADDQAITNTSEAVKGTRLIPNTGGGWSWTNLRRINFYLAHSNQCSDTVARVHYDAVARFFRAWFYYKKVRMFGDVPWYSEPIGSSEETMLKKARDSRKLVVDSILADLDYAIAHLPADHEINQATKWTALALKSRVCLFEGTFRKYHQNDVFGKDSEGNALGDGKDLLQECVDASEKLMAASGYAIYTSTPDKAYLELFSSEDAISQEVILARSFNKSQSVYHDANFRTLSSSYGRPGVTKSFVNSYLMKDGSRFTDIAGYQTMQFYAETQDRDPRLAQTIRTPGYTRIGSATALVPDFSACITGYQWAKFITTADQDNSRNTNDLPVFRYAEALLNFAEAKAELGTLTQGDLDRSIKLIRDRVGMPNINLADANNNPDPFLAAQYKHVSGPDKGVILEIRRERRIELTKEGFRYWDLMRWDEGHLLTDQFEGMYFPGVGDYDLDHNGDVDLILYNGAANEPSNPPAGAQVYDLNNELILENGANGGNVIPNPGLFKQFKENKDYLYPLPVQERLLNRNLKQNPGWDDGIN